ncbi:unnamed protein product [Phaedon cochleariae]|uniref:RRM domain-containing protein n=1 Tax=Phaedon cochleariae TaxID=80249 RepID=A0A9P0GQV6_PHACE|nr:unnamed protein product [Phaedon cochleariae]
MPLNNITGIDIAKPCISLNADTGDPNDFTLYATSDLTDIAKPTGTGQEHVFNTSDRDKPLPLDVPKNAGRTSNSEIRHSQSSKYTIPKISERNMPSSQGQFYQHPNVMLQNPDLLLHQGLQIQNDALLPPISLWDANMMGLEFPLLGVNDVLMNPHLLPPMPVPAPEPVFAGNDHLDHGNYPTPITPICAPIDCTSCVVHPPSKGSSLPLVQKKPLGCRTIFVGGIPKNMTRIIIRDIFQRFGNITDIRMNSKFCHVRFEKGYSVDAAVGFSGCRVTIGHSRHIDDTGLIFVDYSKAKDDLREWEMAQQKKVSEAAPVRRKDKSPSPALPPVIYCNDLELTNANRNIKQNDTFLDVIPIVKTWFDKGECNRGNIDRIYSILQNANGHVRRLNEEKIKLIKDLLTARDECKGKVRTISSQLGHIEGLFVTASQQKVWDHFSKAQRKNLDDWKKELKKHKKAGPHNQTVLIKENDDMDVSDDDQEPMDKEHNTMVDLARENVRLKHQLDAAKKRIEAYKMEQIKEEKLKEELIEKMETSMKLFKEESLKDEAKIKELKIALQAAKKATEEFSKKENIKISKLEKENNEQKQQLALEREKFNNINKELSDVKMQSAKEKETILQDNKKLVAELENQVSVYKKMGNDLLIKKKAMRFQQIKTIEEMFCTRESKLIGIISAYLVVHPVGVSFTDIVQYVQTLDANVSETELQSLLKKSHFIFRLESGIGWTLNTLCTDPTFRSAGYQMPPNAQQPVAPETIDMEVPEANETIEEIGQPTTAEIEMADKLARIQEEEAKRLKFIYFRFRDKPWSPAFERRIQEFRGATEPLTKSVRRRIKINSPKGNWRFIIPSTTPERMAWLRENVPIPEKYEEELILERQGSLPNFSDEKAESSNVDAPKDLEPADQQTPKDKQESSAPVTLEYKPPNCSKEEEERLFRILSMFRSPGLWSLELKKILWAIRPVSLPADAPYRLKLTSGDGSTLNIDIPQVSADVIKLLDTIEVPEILPEEKFGPTKDVVTFTGRFPLKDQKRVVYISRYFSLVSTWSQEFQRWVQDFRSPNMRLHITTRLRFHIFGKNYWLIIPRITPEELEWLRENVSVPEKFPEEEILQQFGLLPDYDDLNSDLWKFEEFIRPIVDSSGKEKFEVIHRSRSAYLDAFASKTEMKRLYHIYKHFRDPTVWSPEFMKRMQELRDPNVPLDKSHRKCLTIDKEPCWIEIPKTDTKKLDWLRNSISIPSIPCKYPEELILEKQGLLLDFDRTNLELADKQDAAEKSSQDEQSSAKTTEDESPFSSREEEERFFHVLSEFKTPHSWSLELKKRLFEIRPVSLPADAPHRLKLRSPDGTILNIDIPPVPASLIKFLNTINVTEKLPEEHKMKQREECIKPSGISTNRIFKLKDKKRVIYITKYFPESSLWSQELARWVQDFRNSTQSLDLQVRRRLRIAGKYFWITIPKITPEKLKWLTESIPIPNKFAEEFTLEKLGILPDFSDDHDNLDSDMWKFTKRVRATIDPSCNKKVEVIDNPETDLSGFATRTEMKRLHHIYNNFRDPTVWSPQFTRRLHELRDPKVTLNKPNLKCFEIGDELCWIEIPNIDQDRLHWLKKNVKIPQKYPEEFILEKRGLLLKCPDDEEDTIIDFSDVEDFGGSADFKVEYNIPLKNRKRLAYICKYFRDVNFWSPEFEKWMQQQSRWPHNLTGPKHHRRLSFCDKKIFINIPELTSERLEWLRKNVSIPDKFPEENILEQFGLLPDFSDDYDDLTSSLWNFTKSINITIDASGNRACEVVGGSELSIVASKKELKRLSHIHKNFSDPAAWSPEYMRRLQELRTHTVPLHKVDSKCYNINNEYWVVKIPPIAPQRLDWLRKTIPIPDKYPEEIILEKKGLLPNFPDDEDNRVNSDSQTENSLRPFVSMKEMQRLRYIHMNFMNPALWSREFMRRVQDLRGTNFKSLNAPCNKRVVIADGEYWFIEVPVITQEQLDWLRENVPIPDKYPEEFILEEEGRLVEFSDDEDNTGSKPASVKTAPKTVPFISMKEKLRMRHVHMQNKNSSNWSHEFQRRIQDLRGPNVSPLIQLRKRVKLSGGESWWITIPSITPERLEWLKENVPVPDIFPEELILKDKGLLPEFPDDEEDDVIPMEINEDDPIIPDSTTGKWLNTPEGLMRLSNILAIFNTPKRWSPELRTVLETLRPANCFGTFTSKLSMPGGKHKKISLPSVTPEALEKIKKVVVPEKLPEEFIIEELSGFRHSVSKEVEASEKDKKVSNNKSSVSERKRKATKDEDESRKTAKRKSDHHATKSEVEEVANKEKISSSTICKKDLPSNLNKTIVQASEVEEKSTETAAILVPIKTEPKDNQVIVIDDDSDPQDENITLSNVISKQIKIEPDDKVDTKIEKDSLVHIKEEPIENEDQNKKRKTSVTDLKMDPKNTENNNVGNSLVQIKDEPVDDQDDHNKKEKNSYNEGHSEKRRTSATDSKNDPQFTKNGNVDNCSVQIKDEPVDNGDDNDTEQKISDPDIKKESSKRSSIQLKKDEVADTKITIDSAKTSTSKSNSKPNNETDGKKRKINDRHSEGTKKGSRERMDSEGRSKKVCKEKVKPKDKPDESFTKVKNTDGGQSRAKEHSTDSKKFIELSENSSVIRNELDDLLDDSSQNDREDLVDTYWSSKDLQRLSEG